MEKGETLLKLISSILDISQIEAGKVRLNFEPVDVAEVIQHVGLQREAAGGEEGRDARAQLPDGAAAGACAPTATSCARWW